METEKVWNERMDNYTLDFSLDRLEAERIGSIRQIFSNYCGILRGIAHLMPQDVSRILDRCIPGLGRSSVQLKITICSNVSVCAA
jgi:hypothetical protein